MKKIEAEIMPVAAVPITEIPILADYMHKMLGLNMFDMDVLSYPRTVMVKASDGEEPLVYMPLQAVLMYDSLAPKPGITPRQEAVCLKKIVDAVDEAARVTGFAETWFICKDDRVADIAVRHGFQEIKNVRVLKKKTPHP